MIRACGCFFEVLDSVINCSMSSLSTFIFLEVSKLFMHSWALRNLFGFAVKLVEYCGSVSFCNSDIGLRCLIYFRRSCAGTLIVSGELKLLEAGSSCSKT